MRCLTCCDSVFPGMVQTYNGPGLDRFGTVVGRITSWAPCPDCNGNRVAHCCDGEQAQPEPGGEIVTEQTDGWEATVLKCTYDPVSEVR
jgi:hypothetical protein